MMVHGGNVYKFAETYGYAIEDVLDFSANINPLGLSQNIEKQLPEILKKTLHYPDPDYKSLYQSLSQFEQIPETHMVVGNGAIECIFLLAEQLKAKHVRLQAPTFIEYERAFKKYGSQVSYDNIDLDQEFEAQSYIETLPKDVDVIVFCNPNNPTGQLIQKCELETIGAYAESHKITLIIDEAFIDFTEDEATNTMKSHLLKYKNLIILKSVTKFFAIPGLRLGYLMAGNPGLVDEIKASRIPWAINTFAVECGKISLEDSAYIRLTKEWIHSERTWMTQALRTIPYLKVYNSEGNYLFFISDVLNLDELLIKDKIMIRNCTNYRNVQAGSYRIAIKDRKSNSLLIESLRKIQWKS